MIPLPEKLIEILRQMDQRRADLLQGFLLAQGDQPGEWSLNPERTALVKKEQPPCES